MKVLDLFSGLGGFSLGLERAGMRTIAFCEIDPFCRAVLAKHWPEVPIYDDVRTAEFPSADIVVGGFPCQDISVAGKRAGVSGERSGLYRELVRALRVVRPQHAIVENVAALLGNGMGTVLGDLAESGFDVEWDCVPACALGAPHERDRVWIIAHANDGHGNADEALRSGRNAAVAGDEPAADADCQRCGEARGVQHPRQAKRVGRGADASRVADTTSDGCGPGRTGRPPDSFAGIRIAACGHAADASSPGLEGWQQPEIAREALSLASGGDRNPWRTWTDEPPIQGVDDGLPDWVDRTRATGNALVPQIVELIGRAIMARAAAPASTQAAA